MTPEIIEEAWETVEPEARVSVTDVDGITLHAFNVTFTVRLSLRERLALLFGRSLVVSLCDDGPALTPDEAARQARFIGSLRVDVKQTRPTFREWIAEIRREATPRGPVDEIRRLLR